MKNLKKFLLVIAMAIVAVSFYANAVATNKIANATTQDACDQEFTYTKSSDFNDNRVDINFESSDRQIDVSAKNGYEVIKIELDVDNDNKSGYFTYATGPVNNFNPNPGDEINNARITVKKICDKVNICHHTSSQSNPIEAIRVNNDAFDGQGNSDHTLHGDFLYFGPVNPQNQQPIKPDGDLWCAQHNPNNTPTPTSAPSATPIPSLIPSVTPTITVAPTVTPTVAPSITPEPSVEPTIEPSLSPEPTEAPSITPTPSIPQGGICDEGQILNENNICINIECNGGGTCEVTNVSPTPTATATPTVTATPSPTSTPSQGGTSSNNSSSNNSSSESKNEAASVNAFANTGAFQETISNAMLSIGAAFTALSTAWYGKKKKANKK